MAEYVGKVVVAGNVVHFKTYEIPVKLGYKKPKKERKEVLLVDGMRVDPETGEVKVTDEKANQLKSGRRAKRRLMDLIRVNSNVVWMDHEGRPCTMKFLTLTFAENVQDLEWANGEFKKFVKRLNYAVTGKKKAFLEYVAVVEFQKRGAVHYHVVFFNLKYMPVKEIEKVWRHGFVKINKIDEVDDLGAYVGKYMEKTFTDPDDPNGGKRRREKGKKRYFTSRGLVKPQEILLTKQSELDQVATDLAQYLTYETKYETEYQGLVTYRQYNMNRVKK